MELFEGGFTILIMFFTSRGALIRADALPIDTKIENTEIYAFFINDSLFSPSTKVATSNEIVPQYAYKLYAYKEQLLDKPTCKHAKK